MKTYTADQLKKIAADVFRLNPKALRVACTSDGMAFIVDDGEASVRNHARTNRYKEALKIAYFNREEAEECEKRDESKDLTKTKQTNPAPKGKSDKKKSTKTSPVPQPENEVDPVGNHKESDESKNSQL